MGRLRDKQNPSRIDLVDERPLQRHDTQPFSRGRQTSAHLFPFTSFEKSRILTFTMRWHFCLCRVDFRIGSGKPLLDDR